MSNTFYCRGCAYSSNARWKGPCPQCAGLWAIMARPLHNDQITNQKNTLANLGKKVEYTPTKLRSFDAVVGGGLVRGSTILFGGSRGAGKSTLLLTIANNIASETRRVIYASGEESAEDVGKIAYRIGATSPHIEVIGNASNVYDIIERAEVYKPFLIVFDSLQVLTCSDVKGNEGSISQGIAVANVITGHCKRTNTCGILINHVTKSGTFAGSTSVEHLVDTILSLDRALEVNEDGEIDATSKTKRVLEIVGKNRNGPEDVQAYFEMTDSGLKELSTLDS